LVPLQSPRECPCLPLALGQSNGGPVHAVFCVPTSILPSLFFPSFFFFFFQICTLPHRRRLWITAPCSLSTPASLKPNTCTFSFSFVVIIEPPTPNVQISRRSTPNWFFFPHASVDETLSLASEVFLPLGLLEYSFSSPAAPFKMFTAIGLRRLVPLGFVIRLCDHPPKKDGCHPHPPVFDLFNRLFSLSSFFYSYQVRAPLPFSSPI